MHWFMDLKISTKLITSFIIVALIAALIGSVGFYYTGNIGEKSLPSVRYLLEIKGDFSDISALDNQLLSPKLSYDERQTTYVMIEEVETKFTMDFEAFDKIVLTKEQEIVWSETIELMNLWLDDHKNFVQMSKNADSVGVDDPGYVRYEIALKQRDHYKWISTLLDDILHKNEFTGQLDGTKCALGLWLASYTTRSEDLQILMEDIEASHLKVHSSGQNINTIIAQNSDTSIADAMKIYDDETMKNMTIVLEKLSEMDQLVTTSDAAFNDMVVFSLTTKSGSFVNSDLKLEELIGLILTSSVNGVKTAKITMIVLIIIGAISALIFGGVISQIIKKPIVLLVKLANQIKEGNLDITSNIHSKDELGQLASAFDAMTENVSYVLARINGASDQVADGARQVSNSSMALSQGATEQASAIEELTATIEEISMQTKQNAASADKAKEMASSAFNYAIQGNNHMSGLLKAMEEINTASSKISKVIKVIDDIAFQTNILALNAAVEAARAGQHGKGFAVVAEEVRNLASKSASAAKETTSMIEGSIIKAEDGSKIASETAIALSRIVEEISKANVIVGDIAIASREQSQGVAQVNQGITQISDVVQTTSATAQEVAAASEELSGQADILKSQVETFRLKR